ncbi:MAG: CsbD family protein [Acidobacteriota bacterium]|nr:CsbD family protein [Acidobacteriota bacterium]
MEPRNSDGTVGEEVSAFGQRAKGAVKDATGAMTGNRSLEREGERENAEGRARQASNNVMDETDGTRNVTGRTNSTAGGYVTGLYSTPESASRAYQDLTTRHGYKSDDINVLMTDDTRKRHFGDAKPGTELDGGTKATEGMGVGGAIGGGVGAAIAALFAVGTSIVIPGLGLVVAGPIAAALAGAGAGAATGGLIGALVGAGIPEERAREYERGLNEGGIVIGTRARDAAHAAELEKDYGSYGGSNVRS